VEDSGVMVPHRPISMRSASSHLASMENLAVVSEPELLILPEKIC